MIPHIFFGVEKIEKKVEEYAASLHLTAIQKTEFEAITRKYTKQMSAVRDSLWSLVAVCKGLVASK